MIDWFYIAKREIKNSKIILKKIKNKLYLCIEDTDPL